MFTQIVLEAAVCLVGVWEAGMQWSRPVVLQVLLDQIRHLQLLETCRGPTPAYHTTLSQLM